MSDKIKNVFISHLHEDDDGLAKLKDLAAKHGLQIRDSSITAEKPNLAKDPDYIKQQILKPQIEWAGALVVYVSAETKDSEYVQYEIEEAQRQGKRIVGVWALGEKDCEIPQALDDYGNAMVGWNGESIVDAIVGNSDDWYDATGGPKPDRPIARYSC